MSQPSPSASIVQDLRHKIDALDAEILLALAARFAADVQLKSLPEDISRSDAGRGALLGADIMRRLVEHHQGQVPLEAVEHIWRGILTAVPEGNKTQALYMDGGAELIDMLDLARFYFGFSVELVPCTDASDVVGAVSASGQDIGLVALNDRADLPWWRGLNDNGATISGRLPFIMLEDRPADLPALVLSKTESLVDIADIAVYDARWSDLLPGKLMDQGIEVLSFFRSAGGVDALLAVSGILPEDGVLKSCTEAGAAPEVLRRVGGYELPIDAGSDPDDVFDPKEEDFQG